MPSKVYLAGPITGLDWEGATDWRLYARERLAVHNILGLSPLRAKNYLNRELSLSDTYDDHPLSTEKAITTRDRFDSQRADLMLVNFLDSDRASLGTAIEFGWADAARVPTVVAMKPGNVHDHAMIRQLSGFVVEDLDQAIEICIAILGTTVV